MVALVAVVAVVAVEAFPVNAPVKVVAVTLALGKLIAVALGTDKAVAEPVMLTFLVARVFVFGLKVR